MTWLAHTRNEIGIWLYVKGDNAEAHFRLLKEQQEEIHDEFGEMLEWIELPGSNTNRICLAKVDTDLTNRSYTTILSLSVYFVNKKGEVSYR